MIQDVSKCILSCSGENTTKYKPNQPLSATSFEPTRKVVFKSFVALRKIQSQNQSWITNMNCCCHLAINSSPMAGKQNVLFCCQRLPLHQEQAQCSKIEFLLGAAGAAPTLARPHACRELKAFEVVRVMLHGQTRAATKQAFLVPKIQILLLSKKWYNVDVPLIHPS